MKIGIIGSTGKSGSLILAEAVNRQHEVTAIVRNKEKLVNKTVPVLEKDLFDLETLDLIQFDVVVDAFNAPLDNPVLHETSLAHLTEILADTKTRLVIVGGAGSLYLNSEHTLQLQDGADFPEAFKPIAKGMGQALNALREVRNVDWLYISPAAFFDAEGKKSGTYFLAGEEFTVNKQNESYISYLDYAQAFMDQVETNKENHVRISVRN